MKLPGKLFFILIFFTGEIPAQINTEGMQEFFKSEFHRIAVKLYIAGKEQKIPAYMNDSLATKFSAKEVRDRGAEYIYRETVDPASRYNPDSMVKIPFDPEKIKQDLSVSFSVTRTADGQIIYKPYCVAPLAGFQINGISLNVPLFYVSWEDFKSILSENERELYTHFVLWKQFGTGGLDIMGNVDSTKIESDMGLWLENGLRPYYSSVNEGMLGKIVRESAVFYLFNRYYTFPLLKMYDKSGKEVLLKDFTEKHSIRFATQVSDWKSAPEKFIDTFYYEPPQSFQNLSILNEGNNLKWMVTCRMEEEKTTSSEHKKIKLEQYYFKDEDVKKVLHPELYFFCKYFAENSKTR